MHDPPPDVTARVEAVLLANVDPAAVTPPSRSGARRQLPLAGVVIVAPDPAAAARVPLAGATALERRVTLALLAGFGADAAQVARVRFDDGAPVQGAARAGAR